MAVNQVWASVVVRRPLDEVWKVISDAEGYAAWCKMFHFEGGPFAEGKDMKLVLPLGFLKLRVPVTVTRFDAEDELRWDASFGGFHGSHWLRVRALNDEQTQVSHGEEYTGLSWIWPHIRHEIHREYQKVADDLERFLTS